MADSKKGWLSDERWAQVQQEVPIVCVDILPVWVPSENSEKKIGLIKRETPREGVSWCLAGGRLLRGETIATAVWRHWRETFGHDGPRDIGEHRPDYVAQYLNEPTERYEWDTRQHAIGLVYCWGYGGVPGPKFTIGGEALDFAWFELHEVAASRQIGFGQKRMLVEMMQRLGRK